MMQNVETTSSSLMRHSVTSRIETECADTDVYDNCCVERIQNIPVPYFTVAWCSHNWLLMLMLLLMLVVLRLHLVSWLL